MARATAITIGAFDGVHRGHRRLLEVARHAAGDAGSVRAITFDPFPIEVLRPDDAPGRLTNLQERMSLLRAAGADEVDVLDPRGAFLETSARGFAQMLRDRYAPDVIVEGPDFRFGHRRAGDLAFLRSELGPHGTTVHEVPAVTAALQDQTIVPVSSSLVRRLLVLGRTRDAGSLLGRRFAMSGEVVSGDRRGRTIGFPTANLRTDDRLLPADGIYSGIARRTDGAAWAAAISIGVKPTFGGSARTCEVHLLAYEGPVDEYGWSLTLEFGDYLRPQAYYGDVQMLCAQMRRDCARVAERERVA